MQHIFICYRREDSQHIAGRIYDRLVGQFQSDGVFIDVDSIAGGVVFGAHLQEVLGQCEIVLVVIGDRWLDVRDADGQPRLHRPDDYVRIEIETALRLNRLVIPLLVAGAQMPQKLDLPESIRALVDRNARPVRPDRDFHRDMDLVLADFPGGPHVEAIQSFALGAGPMLRRVQSAQPELERLAREADEIANRLLNGPRRGPRSGREAAESYREWNAAVNISSSMKSTIEHSKPYVSFAEHLDPRIGIGLKNIAEVVERFRELRIEAEAGTKWCGEVFGALGDPCAPASLAARAKSVVEEVREQLALIRKEAAKVKGID